MASSSLMIASLLLLAAAGAAAQATGNMAYLPPLHQTPGLAKAEPLDLLDQLHGRSLLAKAADPAKSKWEPKTNKASDAVFVQGVASGDPFPKSVILWTRVTPMGGLNKPAFLDYAVATDKKFTKIVTRGTTLTTQAVDFTAKVDARGLKPNTKYFYQWRYRQNDKTAPVYSNIGRTRTIPRATDDIARARIAFFSCSQLPTGFFTSYGQVARMADRGEVDYTIHVGDYIYEGATNGSTNIASPADRIARTHQPQKEILSVLDYRTRHNQYNTDVDTKAMREAAVMIPVWDDHEYTNDAWKGGAQNHQPATEGDWDERRLRALQVYYEMMPLRQANADNKQQIYRNFEIGKLIKLIMLDTRVIGRDLQNATDASNPNRTILGAPQTTYLKSQLSAGQGAQTWKVLGQQVLFIHRCDSPSADQWDGYRQSRFDVLSHIESNKIDNVIILTGDIHTHWAADVPKFPCPKEANFSYNNATGAGSLAVEFVSSSITSGWNPNANRTTVTATQDRIKAANPHVKYQESFYHGFALLDIRRKYATSTWYYAPDLSRAGQYNTMVQGESWRVNAGENRLVSGTADI